VYTAARGQVQLGVRDLSYNRTDKRTTTAPNIVTINLRTASVHVGLHS